jgi:hypothetical protein
MLEINAELLKCDFPTPTMFACMTDHLPEYVWSSGLGPSPPMTRDISSLSIRYSKPLNKADVRAYRYASRLQSNLSWLAAAADAHHTQNRHPLPNMQPPPPIDFASTERVRQLYLAMPATFARDIARGKGQLVPVQSTPTLKRERTAEEPELSMKRRDTGESKAVMGMPPPATPALAAKTVAAPTQPFAGVVSQGATPDRTRVMQMRQQQAQFQPQVSQVQQPHVAGVRQMSPPQVSTAGVGMGIGVGQGQGQQAGTHATTMQQVVSSFGPQGVAFMQQLQDPNSHFVKYMVEQIPNFMSLPLLQQLKRMQQAQVRLLLVRTLRPRLTDMLPIANDTAETACSAATSTAATTATAPATAATATTAIATTAQYTPTTTAATSSATAKPRESQPWGTRRSDAITTTNGRSVTKQPGCGRD